MYVFISISNILFIIFANNEGLHPKCIQTYGFISFLILRSKSAGIRYATVNRLAMFANQLQQITTIMNNDNYYINRKSVKNAFLF